MQAAKIILLNNYIRIKEKALAIDASNILNTLEGILYENMTNSEGISSQSVLNKINILNNYIRFFDLLKQGRDFNARVFALKIGKINFDSLRTVINQFDGKDEELLKYLEFKEEMVNEASTDDFQKSGNKYSKVRELYQFLLNARTRDCVKDEENPLMEAIFEQYKSEILSKNKYSIELYNRYARKHGMYICPTSTIRQNNINIGITYGDEDDGSRG